MTEAEYVEMVSDLLDAHFPKGKCSERGNALVVVALIRTKLVEKGLITNGNIKMQKL